MSRNPKNELCKKSLAGESVSPKPTPSRDTGTVTTDLAGVSYMTYAEQIKSPRWQKKRLEILERENFTCQFCKSTDKQLHVHHVIYNNRKLLWQYDDDALLVLCEDCHNYWHTAINDTLLHMAFNMTNIKPRLTWRKLELFLDYYTFEPLKMDKFFKKASEYKYPWNEK